MSRSKSLIHCLRASFEIRVLSLLVETELLLQAKKRKRNLSQLAKQKSLKLPSLPQMKHQKETIL